MPTKTLTVAEAYRNFTGWLQGTGDFVTALLGTADQNDATTIAAWKIAKALATRLSTTEVVLRKKLAERAGADAGVGTHTVEESGGKMKVVLKRNYTVDRAALDTAKGMDNGVPWDDLINYTPTVSVRVYNKLTPAQRVAVADVITTKPATPVVEWKGEDE